jgi:hypothetical protein
MVVAEQFLRHDNLRMGLTLGGRYTANWGEQKIGVVESEAAPVRARATA